MDDKKTISFKMEKEQWGRLKMIAINKNVKLHQVMNEMINDYITKNGDK